MASAVRGVPLFHISPSKSYPAKTHILDLPVEVFVLILNLLWREDLLRCATVCSKWRDLALDVRWKEHSVGWDDLLRILGPLQSRRDEGGEYHLITRHLSVKDAIASVGWRRLDDLRKKITLLRIKTYLRADDIDYLENIHRALGPPHQAFFPKLRELVVCFQGSQPYEYDFLAGESLRCFRLDQIRSTRDRPEGDSRGILKTLATRSPMVEHIQVWSSDSPFINYGRFSNLRTLYHSGDFSVASWINLCTDCLLLEDVTLQKLQENLVDRETIALGPQLHQFPPLQILDIESIENKVLNSYILRTTNMPQLTELKVDTRQLISAEADGLISLLGSRSPFLTTLQVYGYKLEWAAFASFSRLRDLELRGRIRSWKAEHVERIVASLPDLDRLSIMSEEELDLDRTKPAFTLATLEKIAMRSRLSVLDIPLNALKIPWTSYPPSVTAKFGILVELGLEPVHIEPSAIEPFAKYLAQLCPKVEDFDALVLHPDPVEEAMEFPSDRTKEERTNKRVIETLFFDIRKEYEVSGSVPEGT
ncbi:hypothetical protein FRC01_004559 [Tulasnella sp. 417]|nr:hypothetical protein FRC01_004559 [Tulasnella sp. 417]